MTHNLCKYLLVGTIFLFVISCSSYKYTAEISNVSNNKKSIEVYLFGVSSDNISKMKAITYDDFWLKVFNSNGSFPDEKKVFYFGYGSAKTQTLDYDDNIWSIWKDSDKDYLCISTYSSDFTDSGRSDVNWKVFVDLKHYNWWGLCSEKLRIMIKDGMPSIEN